MKEHPEYFPEEVERERRWNLIPQQVHDAYLKELSEFNEILWKDAPKSGGIFEMINNSEASKKYYEFWDKAHPIQEAKEKELHKKYYSKYNI
jgi:hypothetical protein